MKRFLAFSLGIFCAILLLVAVYTNIPYISAFIHKTELQTIDYRMKFSRQPEISDAIKIILVNDVTNLSDKLATFIRLMSLDDTNQFTPKVIGLNYRFDGPVNEELVNVASMANTIYYGYSFVFASQQSDHDALNQGILPFRLELTDIGDNSFQKVFEAQKVQLPSHKYLTTARGIGFVNTLPDIDGVFRRIPFFLKYQEYWYGSLALLIAMEYLDIESVDITFYPGQYVEITRDDGDLMKIPINQYGEMLIDFAYKPDIGGIAPFETLSMEDILAQKIPSDQLASLKDTIVLIGSEELPQPIPLSPAYPLIGIFANFITNILTNSFIKELQSGFSIGIILIVGMVTGLILGSHRVLVKLLVAILLCGIYASITYGAFFQFKLVLPVLPPLLTIGLTFIITSLLIRHKKTVTVKSLDAQTQPVVKEKKRKVKTSSHDLTTLEDTLLEVREELDRKSLRLRSKVDELRVLQEEVRSNHYDYSRQVASLQKEIRAREIEIKGLFAKEEELRRQVENLPFIDVDSAQLKGNSEQIRQLFAQYGFITQNEQVLGTLARVEKFSKTSVTVIIQGEPGTGKKLLAGIIGELSPRHNRPIFQVLCDGDMDMLEDDLFGHRKGAFPGADDHRAGFLRKVDEGTLILEEFGNLSLEIQTRLIQAARGKAVRPLGEDIGYPSDVRMLGTTSQNVKDLVSQGKFREDLYHYLSVFPLYLPPLRDRKEDIPSLVNYFVKRYNHIHSKIVDSISDDAIHLLIQHQWPGNITELGKVIERAIIQVHQGQQELSERYISFEEADLTGKISEPGMLSCLIALMDHDRELPAYQPLREKVLAEIQRLYCARLLRLHRGNVKSAAVDAGLKVDTFKKMLTELMVDPENYR